MEAVLDFLQANPIYAAGAVLLVIFFIISLIKKAVTLIVMAVVLNFAFAYYLHDIANEAVNKANDAIENTSDAAKDLFN